MLFVCSIQEWHECIIRSSSILYLLGGLPHMKTSVQGITRFDYGNTHGYVVRYMRDRALFQKLFSDGRYGSEEAAFEVARLYLTELKNAFPPMNRREFSEIKRKKNSKSGLVGVYKNKSISRKRWTYEFWVAQWTPTKGEYKHKRFSINKYGEEEAKRLAIEARQSGLREMELSWPEGYRELIRKEGAQPPNENSLDNPAIREVYAFEGELKYRLHIERERNKILRQAAIENFRAVHKDIRCEICGFSFEEKYGVMGRDLIEVHHIIPLSTLSAETLNSVSDLMLVCANCHFVIHNGNPDENLRSLKILFSGESLAGKRHSSNSRLPPMIKPRVLKEFSSEAD